MSSIYRQLCAGLTFINKNGNFSAGKDCRGLLSSQGDYDDSGGGGVEVVVVVVVVIIMMMMIMTDDDDDNV